MGSQQALASTVKTFGDKYFEKGAVFAMATHL